jgi:HK97 family phage portal protein
LQTDKQLGSKTRDLMLAQLAARHEGLGNQARTMILEEGLKWSKEQMTSVEADTVNARRLQIEQIATAFDVPLHRLGIIPDGGGTAILQAHQMYLNNTLSSDAERWENKLNDMFGFDGMMNGEIGVEFDLDYFNRADIQTRLTALRTGIIGASSNQRSAPLGRPAGRRGRRRPSPAHERGAIPLRSPGERQGTR